MTDACHAGEGAEGRLRRGERGVERVGSGSEGAQQAPPEQVVHPPVRATEEVTPAQVNYER